MTSTSMATALDDHLEPLLLLIQLILDLVIHFESDHGHRPSTITSTAWLSFGGQAEGQFKPKHWLMS